MDISKATHLLWWLSAAAVGEEYFRLSNAWLPLSIEREKGTFALVVRRAQSSSRPRTQPRGYINNIDSMVSYL